MVAPRDDRLSEEEKRVSDLVTGFALGELTNEEMEELYGFLRQPGSAGEKAAIEAWQVLGTVVDLRSAVSKRFSDTVNLRVLETGEHSPAGDTGRSFVGSLIGWLGLTPPRLSEVEAPRSAFSFSRRRAGAVLVLSILALFIFIFLARDSGNIATVTAVRGLARVGDRSIALGDTVGRQPVSLPEGGRLTLLYPQGHEIEVKGPANLILLPRGVSLSSGMAKVHGADVFTVGLPDGSIDVSDDAEFSVEIDSGRSVIGVSSGKVMIRNITRSRPLTVRRGQAAAMGGGIFPWITEGQWVPKAHSKKGQTMQLLGAESDCRPWRMQLKTGWSSKKDQVLLMTRRGKEAARLTPGLLTVFGSHNSENHIKLSGAPLLSRQVVIEARLGEKTVIRLEGQEIPLPRLDIPPRLKLIGKPRLVSSSFHNGPSISIDK